MQCETYKSSIVTTLAGEGRTLDLECKRPDNGAAFDAKLSLDSLSKSNFSIK
jgi:hypothetical protein